MRARRQWVASRCCGSYAMNKTRFTHWAAALTGAALLSLASSATAAAVVVSSYSYLTGPSSSYPDSGGELINGITFSKAWSNPPTTINGSDVVELSGWRSTNPRIRFNFAEVSQVQSFTVWAADSNNGAGVGLPSNILLRSLDNTLIQSFSITDPPGSGSTVPLVLSGFSVNASSLIVEIVRDYEWTMLSEVQFSSVPEASTVTVAGLLGVAAIHRRRRVS